MICARLYLLCRFPAKKTQPDRILQSYEGKFCGTLRLYFFDKKMRNVKSPFPTFRYCPFVWNAFTFSAKSALRCTFAISPELSL